MRMAFKNIVKPPKTFKFIADGYPAYPLVAQQFALNKDNPLNFDITYQHRGFLIQQKGFPLF